MMNSPRADGNPYISVMPRRRNRRRQTGGFKTNPIFVPKIQNNSRPQQPKRKKPSQNAVARGLLGVVSGGANMLAPGTGKLVDLLGGKLLNALGLSEKVVLPNEYGGSGEMTLNGGGAVVASADAPVQFGRTQEQSAFTRVLHRAGNGDVIIHTREPLLDLVTSGTLNTAAGSMNSMYPFNVNLTVIKQMAANYSWYRFLAVRIHYTHWAPTSTQARVTLCHVPTDTFNNSVLPSQGTLARMEHFAAGSAYEDFGLEFEPTNPQNWFPCFPAMGTAPSYDISQGSIVLLSDLNNVTSATIGTIYVEFVTAFREQRAPGVTIGIVNSLLGSLPKSIVLKTLGRIYSSLPELEADKLIQSFDPFQFADAIKRVRRAGVNYAEGFDRLVDFTRDKEEDSDDDTVPLQDTVIPSKSLSHRVVLNPISTDSLIDPSKIPSFVSRYGQDARLGRA